MKALPTIAEPIDEVPAYDGARGVFILWVMLFHFYYSFPESGENISGSLSPLLFFIKNGSQGVQLFFILSGFLLFRTSLRRINIEKNFIRNFYIRRCFRILPMWWFSTAILTVYLHKPISAFFLNASFAFGFIRGTEHVVNIVGWSLFVEEVFYIFFPLLVRVLSYWPVSLIFFIVADFIATHWISWVEPLGWTNANNFLSCLPISHMHFFFAGIFLVHLTRGIQTAFKNTKFQIALFIFDIITILIIFMDYKKGEQFSRWTLIIFFLTIVMQSTLMNRIVSIKPFKVFGLCCFSIYLLHIYIFEVLIKYIGHRTIEFFRMNHENIELQTLVLFPLSAGVCIALASLTFILVEVPLIKLGRFYLKEINTSAR